MIQLWGHSHSGKKLRVVSPPLSPPCWSPSCDSSRGAKLDDDDFFSHGGFRSIWSTGLVDDHSDNSARYRSQHVACITHPRKPSQAKPRFFVCFLASRKSPKKARFGIARSTLPRRWGLLPIPSSWEYVRMGFLTWNLLLMMLGIELEFGLPHPTPSHLIYLPMSPTLLLPRWFLAIHIR